MTSGDTEAEGYEQEYAGVELQTQASADLRVCSSCEARSTFVLHLFNAELLISKAVKEVAKMWRRCQECAGETERQDIISQDTISFGRHVLKNIQHDSQRNKKSQSDSKIENKANL